MTDCVRMCEMLTPRACNCQPLLNPFEAEVALKGTTWRPQYPMDFYAEGSGRWTNYYKSEEELKAEAEAKAARRAARRRRRKAKASGVAAPAGTPQIALSYE